MPATASLVLLLLVSLIAAQAGAENRRPNILFILVDDLGWSDLACYGADLHETPHLDRLASEGMRFTQAYSASPVCTPTRASLLTGKHPARLQMTIWHESARKGPNQKRPLLEAKSRPNLALAHHTSAEMLRDLGYHTWHLGKWHLGDAEHAPQAHGFDLNIGGTHWGAPNTFWHPFSGDQSYPEFRYVPGLPFGKKGDYLTDRLTDEAIKLLDQRGDKPFFLNLAYHNPHTPIEAKPERVDYFKQKLRPQFHHQNPAYAAMIHHLDENVGRLLKALDERQLRENTAVIFYSDNGGYINNYKGTKVTNNHPLRSGKGSCYEGGIRVPLIVRWPRQVDPGSVCNATISSPDFLPTFRAIANWHDDRDDDDLPDGRSFFTLLHQPEAKWPLRPLVWHYPHYYPTTTPVSAIRDGVWKLIRFTPDRYELYNLADDPGESRSLSASDATRVKKLSRDLEAALVEMQAARAVPNPNHKSPPGKN